MQVRKTTGKTTGKTTSEKLSHEKLPHCRKKEIRVVRSSNIVLCVVSQLFLLFEKNEQFIIKRLDIYEYIYISILDIESK